MTTCFYFSYIWCSLLMIESQRWYYFSQMFWVILVDGGYFLYPTCWSSKIINDFIPLGWDSFYGLVTSNSFNSTPWFQEASQFVQPSRILRPYLLLAYFDHFDWFFFIRIVSYGVYHVSRHPPIKFQANILCVGWILEVVTLWLPLLFHPRFS